MNPYKKILKENLTKLLNLYNTDKCSVTYGYGDREFWAWKIKDFSNSTMQGGVHSLAIAIKLGLFEKVEEKKFIFDVIDSAILAIKNIIDKNGSACEAYPAENSFCVTALVAFDVLSCIFYLDNYLDEKCKNDYLNIIRPLVHFITKHDEKHAIISNHLATSVAAIALWNKITGETNSRYQELLKLIYDNQSEEGWYKEYEGADPGYQTLCTYYLYCAYMITFDQDLLDSLKKSAKFLSFFIHPNGTIGGLYGSRNTEIFYPGGIISLANEIEEFALIAKFLEPKGQHILPQNIDIGNYIPLLNSYAVAALNYDKIEHCITNSSISPFFLKTGEKIFEKAGIYMFSNIKYFAILNFKKGGVLKVFDKNNSVCIEDGGLFGVLKNGKKISSQKFDDKINFTNSEIVASFYCTNESLPTPLSFVVLRIFSMSIFKSVFLGDLFKKFIVRLLMTGKNKIDGCVKRKFVFLKDKIIVKEKIQRPKNCIEIGHVGKSKVIHMASSGYLLPKDAIIKDNSIVEFKNV